MMSRLEPHGREIPAFGGNERVSRGARMETAAPYGTAAPQINSSSDPQRAALPPTPAVSTFTPGPMVELSEIFFT